MVAKNCSLEEIWRLFYDGDEEVCDRWRGGEEEDDTDEEEGARDGAHLTVVQGEADRDVALHGHAGQNERGGARGENGCRDLREAKRWCWIDGLRKDEWKRLKS